MNQHNAPKNDDDRLFPAARARRPMRADSISPLAATTTADALPLFGCGDAEGRVDSVSGWISAQQATKTDAGSRPWTITDNVVRLRQWGTRAVFELPAPTPARDWTIGAAADCWLRLTDPKRLVSRRHARLVHDGVRWQIEDLDSKNGLGVDGARRTKAVLEPGIEIGMGGITLIAESGRLIALRGFLERMLGWADRCLGGLDHALRALRVASTRRMALMLCGDGDLVQIARSLHTRTLGPGRPFVVCDPRRRTTTETVRSATNHGAGMAALHAAAGGSLCVWARRLPRDFDGVEAALRDPASRVQLVVCAGEPREAGRFGATPIAVPPLATRGDDLVRIVDEYAADAIAMLGLPPNSFSSSDRNWVLEHAADSLPEIEKATLRLLAIREAGNLNRAAVRLGMARISLKNWVGRRPLPMAIDD